MLHSLEIQLCLDRGGIGAPLKGQSAASISSSTPVDLLSRLGYARRELSREKEFVIHRNILDAKSDEPLRQGMEGLGKPIFFRLSWNLVS